MAKKPRSKSIKKEKNIVEKADNKEIKSDIELEKFTPVLNLKEVKIDKPENLEIANPVNKINYKLIAIIAVINLLVVLLITGFFVFSLRSNNVNSNQNSSSSQESSSSSQNSENSSSDSSSSISSESSSSLSVAVSSSSSVSVGPTAASYTNQYYPDLKINYDSSWAFSTTTSETSYKNVLSRDLIFIKNGVLFTVGITPSFVTGCGGPSTDPNKMKETKIGGNLSRFKSNYTLNKYHYLPSGGAQYEECIFFGLGTLNSNLVSKDYTAMMKDKYVKSWITISVTGTDQNTIKEVDKIVLNSKFVSKSR